MNLETIGIPAGAAFVLNKLVDKPLTELGEILADRVRFWRFKNQIHILEQAGAYAKSRGLDIKPIHLKTLLPLLDGASLEEEPTIQELWARLLVNAGQVEVPQSISHIAVELLKSTSTQDARVLEAMFKSTLIIHNETLQAHEDLFKSHPEMKVKFEYNPHAGISRQRIATNTLLTLSEIELSIDNISRFEIIRPHDGGDLIVPNENRYGTMAFTKLGWQIICLIQSPL